jgi:flagellar protein FlaI
MISFLKKVEDITKVDVSYELIPPYAFAHIYYDKNSKELRYEVVEPYLSEEEKKILEKIKEVIIEFLEVDITSIKEEKMKVLVQDLIKKAINYLKIKVSKESLKKIEYYIFRDFVGYNEIEPLLRDPYIEDISCSGINLPIFVVHRIYGTLKTNIVYDNVEKLKNFIIKLAQRSGRFVTYAEPILEAALPDGSRVSANFSEEVSTKGPNFTIRKFTEKPFSVVELIELGTLNEEIAAYLWLLIEHKISALIIGGVGSGKTSLLTSLGQFILPEAKIVSIEDTRELRFVHEHWVPLVTRGGFGVPLPTGQKYGEVTLFDLLRESFRMNPDYVIVGEARGREVYVMFQGMASGHPCLSTFHAENVEAVIKRLIAPPIELPISLIEALDLIITMRRAKEKGEYARRIVEIAEIVEVKNDKVITNITYKWDSFNDSFIKENESIKLKKISEKFGVSVKKLMEEIEKRKKVIEWMRRNKITSYNDVAKIIKLYYKDRESVIKMIEGKVSIEELKKREIKDVKEVAKELGYLFVKINL